MQKNTSTKSSQGSRLRVAHLAHFASHLMLFCLLILALPAFAWTDVADQPFVDWSEKRVFEIRGTVDDHLEGEIENLKAYRSKERAVHVLINSPGGNFHTTSLILEAFETKKKSGYNIHCAIPELAASAAAYVASGCDEIIFGRSAWMMWHAPTIPTQGQILEEWRKMGKPTPTDEDFRQAGISLGMREAFFDDISVRAFGFAREDYLAFKEKETYIPAVHLKRMKTGTGKSGKGRIKITVATLIAFPETIYLPYLPLQIDGDYLPELTDDARATLVFFSKAPKELTPGRDVLPIGYGILKKRSGVKVPPTPSLKARQDGPSGQAAGGKGL